MTITDQIGLIEAERDRLKTENETLKTQLAKQDETFKIRIAKQAGAQEENRAQNTQLIARVGLLSARVAYLEKHFYDFHGSAEQIERQRKDIAEQGQPTVTEIVNSPARVASLKERFASIMGRDEKATNGAAH